MRVLGLDPGGEGALVVLDADDEASSVRPIFAAAWRPSGDRHEVSWTGAGAPTRRRAADDTLVGALVRLCRFGLREAVGVPDAVVFEGAYVGANVRTALIGTATRGSILAVLQVECWLGASVPVREVANGSWWNLCGLPPGARDREERKAKSLELVPPLLPGLRDLLAQIPGGDHATDAAAIARVGIRHGAPRGTASEWDARIDLATGRRRKTAKRSKPREAPAPVRRTRTAR